ncbi:metallophosphoesterase [Vibrio natriegens]|uniref:metallophosphoesterase n=1 Tax=Vibrio natriegens TaxID=691 RepID=UPI001EFE9237|nr:metallophosphoesterase [Vibrio natriegens]MCG9702440.1 metallophosphoesterase [Vibrio natriegens]
MNRREFIKLSASGLSTYGVMGNLIGCHSDTPSVTTTTPFIIPNNTGTTTKFAVIGDVHANGNLLKSTLEEIERQGIKHVLLVGDQTDTPNPNGYLDGHSEVETYMAMIKNEQFDQRLNLYPVRGNHEGTAVMDNNDFDGIKTFWTQGVGSLLDNKANITKSTFLREDTGEHLDCCGLYSFVIDVLMIDGMLEQTGTLTDELGNILNPGEGGQWYNESIRTQDTFTLTVDISHVVSRINAGSIL